jgi:WD40 repeat protein
LVDVARRRESQVAHEMPVSLDWSPGGDRFAVRTPGELSLYASAGTRIWTISRNADGPEDVAWSPSGRPQPSARTDAALAGCAVALWSGSADADASRTKAMIERMKKPHTDRPKPKR